MVDNYGDIFLRAQRGEIDLKKICYKCQKEKPVGRRSNYKACKECEEKSHDN